MNTILSFPNLVEIEKIQEIRGKYDPLFDKIRPHVTFVFPIKTEEDKLVEATKKASNMFKKFYVKTGDIKHQNKFLYLDIIDQENKITKIHEFLYEQNIPDNRIKELKYYPHITIGVLSDEYEAKKVAEENKNEIPVSKILIDKISIERIEKDDSSTVIFEIELME